MLYQSFTASWLLALAIHSFTCSPCCDWASFVSSFLVYHPAVCIKFFYWCNTGIGPSNRINYWSRYNPWFCGASCCTGSGDNGLPLNGVSLSHPLFLGRAELMFSFSKRCVIIVLRLQAITTASKTRMVNVFFIMRLYHFASEIFLHRYRKFYSIFILVVF